MTNRYAALDVGSNSVKLLVASGRPDVLSVEYDRAIITRLSEGMQATGRLHEGPIDRTVATIGEMMVEANVKPELINGIVTAPGRAANGDDFVRALTARTGVNARVVTGNEEAGYTLLATQRAFPEAHRGLMVDLGGASTEFVLWQGQDVRPAISLDIGAVRLTDAAIGSDPPAPADLEAARSMVASIFGDLWSRLTFARPERGSVVGILVSGTATTLAAIHLGMAEYDPERVHRSSLSRADIIGLRGQLGALTVAQKKAVPGLPPKRADVIFAGAVIVESMMDVLGLESLQISDHGARWGVLWESVGQAP